MPKMSIPAASATRRRRNFRLDLTIPRIIEGGLPGRSMRPSQVGLRTEAWLRLSEDSSGPSMLLRTAVSDRPPAAAAPAHDESVGPESASQSPLPDHCGSAAGPPPERLPRAGIISAAIPSLHTPT